MPSMETAQVILPKTLHRPSLRTLNSRSDVEILKNYLVSKTFINPSNKIPYLYSNSSTLSRCSSVLDSTENSHARQDSVFSDNLENESISKHRRTSLPGGTEKLRSMVFQKLDQRHQFSFLDFETHSQEYHKRHSKSVWEKLFSKYTLKDCSPNDAKVNGILDVLSSKVAILYFLAFLLERHLESSLLFLWDCEKSSKEAPVTMLVHDYCLEDSPLLLPTIPNVNYEKIASAAMNRDDLIVNVSKAISPLLVASYELFLSSTLFLSFESIGSNGSFTKRDQDMAIKTLSRYISAYTSNSIHLTCKIAKIDARLKSSLDVDVVKMHKNTDVVESFQKYAVDL